MHGQNSGLSGSIRKIFAKIQKEFHFPRVVIVRCRIQINVAALKDEPHVTTRKMSPLTTVARTLQTQIVPTTRREDFGTVAVQSVVPLSKIQTTAIQVPCYAQELPKVIRPELTLASIPVVAPNFDFPVPNKVLINSQVEPPACEGVDIQWTPRVRGGPMLARTLPFYLKVIRASDLNKGLLIRYRAQVLKQIGGRTQQIKLVGVVANLPAAPLSLLKYESDPQGDQVLVRLLGDTNPALGRRSWAFVQLDGKEQKIHLTVKEEEA